MNTLNNLWRKLLTCFLSFMLFSFNLTIDYQTKKLNISTSSAYAQTTKTVVDNGSTTKGKSGTVEIEGSEGSFLFDSGAALLVFIAAAMVIYKLITTCAPIGYDIYGAALGAGIFLMGELMSIFTTKNELKAKTLEYKTRGEDGKIDDEQYQALLKEKEMMEHISKEADKRSKFQSAAAVVFGASAVTALFMEAKTLALSESCTGAIALSQFCSPILTPIKAEEEAKRQTIFESIQKSTFLQSSHQSLMGGLSSCVSAAAAAAASSAGTGSAELALAENAQVICASEVTYKSSTESACVLSTNPLFGETQNQSSPNLYTSLLEAFIPKAHAAGMTSLITGIAGAVAGYYIGQSKYINSLITTPNHRAILWGALSAYGFMVSANTKKTSEAAKENAAKIDKILGLMDRSRTKTSLTSNVASAGRIGVGQLNLGTSNEFGTTLPCSNGGTTDAKGQLVCKAAPFSTNSNFSGGGDLPTGLAPIFSAAGNLINDSQGSSSASDAASSAIDTINGYQNAVAKGLEKAQLRLNNVLSKTGKKPIDFKKEQAKLFSSMQNKVKNDLAKNGLTPSIALGKLGLGTASDTQANKEEKAAAQDQIAPVGGKGISPTNKDLGFEFNLTPEETLAAHNAELKANADAAAETGEIKDDIIKDKSENLFKIISIRYKKAYDRLLDEL